VTDVRDYYDANTWKFLLLGSEGAIHRELWGPTVRTRREALHHAHQLVLDQLIAVRRGGGGRVLDLGCGVGAASLFLAERTDARIDAVSISPRQIATARRWERLRRPALRGACAFHEADFCRELPPALRGVDLAFAIESFVHAPSAADFFRQVAGALRRGGRLIVIDDFLAPAALRPDPAAARLLADVRAGWHMHSLVTEADATAIAAGHGLERLDTIDLSALQRLGRPRDRVVAAVAPLLRRATGWSAWCRSLVGGDALQRCHRLGALEYLMLVLERR
jgi:SAM-dependent methyltransferase